MQSVINVIQNRAKQRTPYAVVYAPLQFSSMSAPHDPELLIQPKVDDPQWILAQELAAKAAQGNLPDITEGATSYYAISMLTPPRWASSMVQTVVVCGQRFLKIST